MVCDNDDTCRICFSYASRVLYVLFLLFIVLIRVSYSRRIYLSTRGIGFTRALVIFSLSIYIYAYWPGIHSHRFSATTTTTCQKPMSVCACATRLLSSVRISVEHNDGGCSISCETSEPMCQATIERFSHRFEIVRSLLYLDLVKRNVLARNIHVKFATYVRKRLNNLHIQGRFRFLIETKTSHIILLIRLCRSRIHVFIRTTQYVCAY